MPEPAAKLWCAHSPLTSTWLAPTRVLPSRHWLKPELPRSFDRSLSEVTSEFSELSQLPKELEAVARAIDKSRSIIELQTNWDGEGSPGYSAQTWSRATNYLARTALACWREFRVVIPPPWITPGPEGSIDLHWQTDEYELLVNLPASSSEDAAFYGDHKEGLYIEGKFDPETNGIGRMALVAWLIND